MDNRKNKDIESVIKDAYDDVKIPLTLDPEIMKERLYRDDDIKVKSFRSKHSHSRYVRIAAVCAVIVICMIMTSVSFTSNDYWNPIDNLINSDSLAGISESEAELSDMYASSYDEIYEILENNNEKYIELYNNRENTDGVAEDAAVSSLNKQEFTNTNVQVAGVDEGDVIKTDGNYIYTCLTYDNKVDIVKADNGKLSKMSEIIYKDNNEEVKWLSDMYISGDNMIVIGCVTHYDNNIRKSYACIDSLGYEETTTFVDVYDISDRKNPVKKYTRKQDGYYISSRINNNYLYVFSDYYSYKDIPRVEDKMIECNDICITESPDSNNFLVMAAYEITQGTVCNEKSVLCGNERFYVTGESIYIVSETYKYKRKKSYYTTKIFKAEYANGNIDIVAKTSIPGHIDSQFSLDEYNSYLRLVITEENKKKTENALYVLDGNLNVVGSIESIAEDERIYSARFYGNYAYFVTYREIDPLFAVDLSDPYNPVIKSKLKVPGFSDYLQRYDENHLFGIGYLVDEKTGDQKLKISMYDISNPEDVTEIDSILVDNMDYSKATEDHKALIIDEERGLIGFSGTSYEDHTGYSEQNYYLYTFDGKLKESACYDCSKMSEYMEMYGPRAVIIGDYIYLSSVYESGKMVSYKLGKKKIVDKLK